MDSVVSRQVGAFCETVLLQSALAPLAGDDSPLGGYGAWCVAESIARNLERDR